MKTYLMADPVRYKRMTSSELREHFLMDSLSAPGEVRLAYIDLDRSILGMANPLDKTLSLPNDSMLRANYFLERREMGTLNIGGSGTIHVNGESYAMDNLDCYWRCRSDLFRGF